MAKSEKTWPKCPACSKEFGKQSAVDDHLKDAHPDWVAPVEPQPDAHSAQPAEAAAVNAAIDEVAAGHGLTREEFDSVIEAPAAPVLPGPPEPIAPPVSQPSPLFRTGPSGTKSAIPANADDAARMAVQAIKTARECMTAVRRAHVQGGASLADEVANPLGRALRMICERFPDADK